MDVIQCWSGQLGSKRKGKIWNVFTHFLVWVIWKEKNERIFEEKEFSLVKVKSSLLHNVFEWACVSELGSPNSLEDFVAFLCFH